MTIEDLVDDYFAKHDACVRAGARWQHARKEYQPEAKALLDDFVRANNARAAAFRALRAARAGVAGAGKDT